MMMSYCSSITTTTTSSSSAAAQKRTVRSSSSSRKKLFKNLLPILLFIGTTVLLLLPVADAGWVDPDTHIGDRTTKSYHPEDDRPYQLVFSDEFEQEGRTFHDGTDPRWTAINKNDYTNDALHFYSHDNAITTNGVLNITTEEKVNVYKAFDEKKKVFYADKKYIQSGMLQSWNKFCFTGGIIEFSAKLPGDPQKGGLWPALWMLGNLARATYVGSTNFVWPFSYNKCDPRTRQTQEISACDKVNHYGLDPYTGRGAPEIDIIESMQGDEGHLPNTFIERPYQSCSFQVAPGIEIDRPLLGHRPHKGHWYENLEFANGTSDLNPFFYGVTLVHTPKSKTYQSDAISANKQLNATHYESQHVYRVEWEPPNEDGNGGYIKWFTDKEFVFGIHSASLDIMQTEIPSEPMYILMNTAVSSSWGFPTPCPDNCECDCYECGNPSCSCALPTGYCDNFPAAFEIDYVRVYQAVNESRHILGCSPVGHPTAQYIEGHSKRFMAEGERRPLQPITKGGAVCTADKECGINGTCTSGNCVCSKGFTGPACLAHDGFYDVDTSKPIPPFSLSSMKVPRSLMVVIALLALGFLLSLAGAIRTREKEGGKYQMVSTSAGAETMSPPGGLKNNPLPASYQNSSISNYAIPPQQQVNTYCVIDSRLVDA